MYYFYFGVVFLREFPYGVNKFIRMGYPLSDHHYETTLSVYSACFVHRYVLTFMEPPQRLSWNVQIK